MVTLAPILLALKAKYMRTASTFYL